MHEIVVNELRRVFKFSSTELIDPNPEISPEAVRDFYSGSYPLLRHSQIEGPEVEGDKLIYSFVQIAKTKGAGA